MSQQYPLLPVEGPKDPVLVALQDTRIKAIDTVNTLTDRAEKAEYERDRMRTQVAMLAALVARVAMSQGLKAGVTMDATASPEQDNLLIIDLPTGQVSFPVSYDDAYVFLADLPLYEGALDGHDNAEKWARVCSAYLLPPA
jgi:hypothetical protein